MLAATPTALAYATPAPQQRHRGTPTPAPTNTPGTTPTSTPTPLPAPTPIASPIQVSNAAAAHACAATIVNGQPLPACVSTTFWPNVAANSVYHSVIPANPAMNPNSSAQIQAYFGSTPGNPNDVLNGLVVGSDIRFRQYDYTRPLYVAKTSDVHVSARCLLSCQFGPSAQIYIPKNALAAGGSDAHLITLQPDNVEVDAWGWTGNPPYANGQTISVSTLDFTAYDGTAYSSADLVPGWQVGAITAGGLVGNAGSILLSELQAGTINHILYLTVACVSATVWDWPSTQSASPCTDGRAALANGSRLWYKLNATQIAASGMSADSKTIANALHTYGGYVADTNGGSPGAGLQLESIEPEWANGAGSTAFVSYAENMGWTHIANASVDEWRHAVTDLDLVDNLVVLAPQ